ncbi:MAG: tRNA (N(6)-L-threonylcarbamoyladenosine(37)-C(2))-methylthiotransferase MtaB [Dehalococcoidia bacterium]
MAFYTLGCKLNQAETETLVNRFAQSGFQVVSPTDTADICIANTCTVTHVADRKSRHWLRLARRTNPRALIIATGCYAQRRAQDLARLADLVVDNREKEHLLDLVQALSLEQGGPIDGKTKQSQIPSAAGRTRSLAKVQDGCHSPCAYCIVPKVRPVEYCRPVAAVVEEVKQKVALGYKEVVLTGTKVGSYRNGRSRLSDLVQLILGSTGIQRLHVSSLQPSEISPEFLALWQDERLCRHLHLALQSGSEALLRRMMRSYSLEQYERALDLIRSMIPAVAITTDIMTGFPGESDQEFEQSYSFCRQADFANIHVFPFSPRPGTTAATMSHQVEDSLKEERTQRMLELSRSSRRSFCERFLGGTMPVLWEKETPPRSGTYSGLTSNYIRVFAHSERPLSNEIRQARLVKLHAQGLWGEVLDENPGEG